MNHRHRCWAEIDLDALRNNLAWIRHRAGPGVQIMTVVKADAYGHGLKEICSTLMQGGTDWFGVANLTEAAAVHRVGPGWPVLLLGPTLADEIDEVIRAGVRATVSSHGEARTFSRSAERLGATGRVHVKVDTGMGRLGVDYRRAARLIGSIRRLPRVEVEGVFTHFAEAEDDAPRTARQLARFKAVLAQLKQNIPFVHAANSGGLLHELESVFNLIRPGLLTYGILPRGRRPLGRDLSRQIEPVLSWKGRVALVKAVKRGQRIGYGGTYRVGRDLKLAIITAGYGDGYSRAAGNRGEILVGGHRCAVLGRVSMDQVSVDVSRVRGVSPGDEAVMLGRQGAGVIDAWELAGWHETIPWEILTGITRRVPRIYRGGTAA